MRYLNERQLREMDADALRAHIRGLQSEIYASSQAATAQQTAGKVVEADAREKMGQAYVQLRETQLAASREISFYWRIINKLGTALGFDGSAEMQGTPAEDWKAYARDLVTHAQQRTASA